MKIFAVLLHAHLLGRQIILHHFRNGKELPNIAADRNYDFNYQEMVFLKKEVEVLRVIYLRHIHFILGFESHAIILRLLLEMKYSFRMVSAKDSFSSPGAHPIRRILVFIFLYLTCVHTNIIAMLLLWKRFSKIICWRNSDRFNQCVYQNVIFISALVRMRLSNILHLSPY